MAIGTIGASSGAVEALPAGAVEKVGTFEVGGIASLGTLQPGKYMVGSSSEVRLLENRNRPITDVQPNGISVFTISEATEVEAELLNPSFSPAPQFKIIDGVRWFNTVNSARPTNISFSADKQTIAIGASSATSPVSFNGGETFGAVAQSSAGANAYGGLTNAGMSNYWSGGVVVMDNGILVAIDPNNNNIARYSSDNAVTWNSWSAPYSGTVNFYRHAAMVKEGNFLYLTLRSENDSSKQAIQKIDWSTGSPVAVNAFEWQNGNLSYAAQRTSNQMINVGGGIIVSYAYTGNPYQFTQYNFNTSSMPTANQGIDNTTYSCPNSSSDALANFYDVGSEGLFVYGNGDRSSYNYPYVYGQTLNTNDFNGQTTLTTFGMDSDPFYETSNIGIGARHSYNRSTNSQNYFNAAGLFSRTRLITRVYVGTLTIYNGNNNDPWYYQVVGDVYGSGQGVTSSKVQVLAQNMLPGLPDSTNTKLLLVNGRWQTLGFKADLQTVSIYRMA
tara:strand:+ start:347 stop:1849 length:1503 start_codon:yes stop_codon:yes gene_type:complete